MSGTEAIDAPLLPSASTRSAVSSHVLCRWLSFPPEGTRSHRDRPRREWPEQGSGVKVSVWLCDLRQVSGPL